MADWAAVVVSIAALALTVWQHFATERKLAENTRREERRTKAQDYQKLLDLFLLQLKTALARAQKGYEQLRADSSLDRFERYPQDLRKHFAQLPAHRQQIWQARIGQLHSANEWASRLIDTYASGSYVDPGFQKECERFRDHAATWKAAWDAVVDLDIPDSEVPTGQIADSYPTGFDAAVDTEIERVKRLAAAE